MTVNYSTPVKDARLGAVASALDAADPLPAVLIIGTTALNGMTGALVVFQLALPSCLVGGGQMVLNDLPITAAVIASGEAALATLMDGAGNPVATGLTVGPLGSGAEVIMHTTNLVAGSDAELLEGVIIHP